MPLMDTVKEIKPVQWGIIAAAGLGLGLLLRARAKSKAAATPVATDTPATTNDTQGLGNYSGSGQTGYYQGGATTAINPNATSDVGTSVVGVTTGPAPGDKKTVLNPDGTSVTYTWTGSGWGIIKPAPEVHLPTSAPAPTPDIKP